MAALGYILTALVGVVIGGLIKGWNSYSEEKFKNLATKEDFKDLKAQTTELRQATKEIEAKIDDQIWNKQRQWELKRDIVIDFVRTVRDFDQTTLAVGIAIKSRSGGPDNQKAALQLRVDEKLAAWEVLSLKMHQSTYLVTLVASKETASAMYALEKVIRGIAGDFLTEKNFNAYTERHEELAKQLGITQNAMREELGVGPIMSQSTVAGREIK